MTAHSSHIDTAWLWPFSVTQQKVARSWSTQLDLIDRYIEYRFTATQAQQFQWCERLYPTLFRRIQEQARLGRFQPIGATWVEMDVNMPSGESLCRQFLYGQRYFESRFGSKCRVFVLPDTCEGRTGAALIPSRLLEPAAPALPPRGYFLLFHPKDVLEQDVSLERAVLTAVTASRILRLTGSAWTDPRS